MSGKLVKEKFSVADTAEAERAKAMAPNAPVKNFIWDREVEVWELISLVLGMRLGT
jgi:hypothetical protein